jgi:hypothetical protein
MGCSLVFGTTGRSVFVHHHRPNRRWLLANSGTAVCAGEAFQVSPQELIEAPPSEGANSGSASNLLSPLRALFREL